jgi:hypothetical protein
MRHNDHPFEGNRAWFRFAFKRTDPKTGEPRSRARMQHDKSPDRGHFIAQN